MKTKFLMALAVAFTLTACEKELSTNVNESEWGGVNSPNKKFTFTLKGDFSTDWQPITRGYMQADGKDMTDVWVFDYVGEELVQQLHLTNTDENWATPSINLSMGTHNIYFVASRGTTPTVNTTNKTITWAKPSDTFWKDYEVTVVSTSNGNRAVTLDRVITRFRATITDAIPDGCASITIAPASWHTGLNYQTGVPTTALNTYSAVITIPDSYVGQTNTLLNLYGFSGTTQWTTNITITAKTSDNDVLGNAIIENVPFKANRSSDYNGTLFGGQPNSLGFTLATDWLDTYEGTW